MTTLFGDLPDRRRPLRDLPPAVTRDVEWAAPAELPSLRGVRRLAIDVETLDPNLDALGPGDVRGDGAIAGLAVGIDGGPRYYLPVGHEGGGNLDAALVRRWAVAELGTFTGEVVGARLAYDLGWLATWGVTIPARRFYDVQVAEPLLDENRRQFNLDALSRDYLGEGKETGYLAEIARAYGWRTDRALRANLWRLPARLVGPYAEGDVDRPLRILPRQLEKLQEEELLELFELESRLIPMLVAMRRRGVPVDVRRGEALRVELVRRRDALVTEIRRYAGPTAELTLPATLGPALEAAGVPVPRTPKTGAYSVTRELLERHAAVPLCGLIREGRKLNVVIGTFLDGHVLRHGATGRVHCEWNQLKSDDGGTIARFSSCLPSTTQIATSFGYKPLHEIKPGDLVWTHRHRYCAVKNKWFTGIREIYKISLKNGRSVTCTSNHRLLTDRGWLSLEDTYGSIEETFGASIYCGAPGNTSKSWSRIERIDDVGTAPVYDLEIEDDHCFLADGIFVHNSNPNLQNVPARDDELAPLMRGVFVPEPGEDWELRDLSQIEYRFLVHYARGTGAAEAREMYRRDPELSFHKLAGSFLGITDPTGETYKRLKNTNFGKLYGGGSDKLAVTFNISREEARAFYDRYDRELPFVKTTFDEAKNLADRRGYVRTILKRRRRFPLFEAADWSRRNEPALPLEAAREAYGRVRRAGTKDALNGMLQGGAADFMKKGMVDAWESGICGVLGPPLLTVHDELDWSVPRTPAGEEASREAHHLMENAIPLRVPVYAEAKRGRSWGSVE